MNACLVTDAESSKNNSTNGNRVIGRPFRKGQSGNPSGRPHARTVPLRDLVQEHAAKVAAKGKTNLQALIERLYNEDPKTYLAYGWGKPVEANDGTLKEASEIAGVPQDVVEALRKSMMATLSRPNTNGHGE